MLEEGIEIAVLVADRPCRALDIARQAGVPALLVQRTGFGPDFDRNGYTDCLVEALEPFKVDLIAMAGFGTILGPSAHSRYPGRILNTHPALLPAFKGWHAVADALAAGVTETGCTVHVATLEVDDGPILAQATVPVLEGDDEASLHSRIKAVERQLYPKALLAYVAQLGGLGPVVTERSGVSA
jgi:phosphoribosylglycinamide formyltransferase-1